MAAFVGKAPDIKARLHEAFACNTWEQVFNNYCVDEETTDLAQAVESFFRNGGSRCYIVNTGNDSVRGGGGRPRGVDVLRAIDEVAMMAAPGATDAASHGALVEHCKTMKDRVCILDVPSDVPDLNALAGSLTDRSRRRAAAVVPRARVATSPPSHRRRRGTPGSPRRTRRTPSRITPGCRTSTRSSPMRSG